MLNMLCEQNIMYKNIYALDVPVNILIIIIGNINPSSNTFKM